MPLPHYTGDVSKPINETLTKWIFSDLDKNAKLYADICQKIFTKVSYEIKYFSNNSSKLIIIYNGYNLLSFYKDGDTYNHEYSHIDSDGKIDNKHTKALDWNFINSYLRDNKIETLLNTI